MPRNNHNKPRRVTSGDSMAEVAATRHGYRKNELVFYDSGKAKRTCLGWCCYYGSCPHWYKVRAALRWYMPNAATQPLWVAKQAESIKNRKYDDFKGKCRAASIIDASLDLTVAPLTFENFGAAGPSAQEIFRGVCRHFSTSP